jgi:hypothetical protein
MAGGGGGSGYLHPTKVAGGSNLTGSGTTPPSGFTRPSGVGIGGAAFGNGGNGVVIIRYVIGRA